MWSVLGTNSNQLTLHRVSSTPTCIVPTPSGNSSTQIPTTRRCRGKSPDDQVIQVVRQHKTPNTTAAIEVCDEWAFAFPPRTLSFSCPSFFRERGKPVAVVRRPLPPPSSKKKPGASAFRPAGEDEEARSKGRATWCGPPGSLSIPRWKKNTAEEEARAEVRARESRTMVSGAVRSGRWRTARLPPKSRRHRHSSGHPRRRQGEALRGGRKRGGRGSLLITGATCSAAQSTPP